MDIRKKVASSTTNPLNDKGKEILKSSYLRNVFQRNLKPCTKWNKKLV